MPDAPKPKRHQDVTKRIKNADANSVPPWDELTKAEREEILDVWMEHGARGFTALEIVARRINHGKSLLSPEQVKRHINTAAAWCRLGVGSAAEVIQAKVALAQRNIMGELNRVQEQLAEGGGVGLPKKTIKVRKRPMTIVTEDGTEISEEVVESVEETITFEDPTSKITALMATFAKLTQVEMIAAGVQRMTNEINAPTAITVHLPGFEENFFTKRPQVAAPSAPLNGNGSKNGKH